VADCEVMAAMGIPQGVRGLNYCRGRLVVPRTCRFPHGRWQWNEKHCEKQIIIRANPVQKGLFEFALENARFEVFHFQRETKQFKVRLPFALAKLPQQNSFELIRLLI
jgi:hypothetical protein